MIRKNIYIILFVFLSSINVIGQGTDVLSVYFKALNYYKQNNNDSALFILEKSNGDIQCDLFRGELYYKNADYTKAIAVFKLLSTKESVEASFYLSLIYAEMGFADESILWLEKYFSNNTSPRFYSQIISQKEFDNISRTPEWREFWNEKHYSKSYEKFEEIVYNINSKKYQDAILLLNSIENSSWNYYKNYLYASVYFYLGEYKDANRYVDLSIGSKGKFIDALRLKYDISKEIKDFNSCYDIVNKLLVLDMYNPEHILEKSEIYYLLSNFDEAENFINKYLSFFCNNEKANYLKAKILVDKKRPNEALPILNNLIKLNSLSIEYYTLRANVFYDFKSWDFAKNDYSMLLDINPNQSEVYYKLGMCYYHMNVSNKACYNWNKAMQMRHIEAKKMLYQYCDN